MTIQRSIMTDRRTRPINGPIPLHSTPLRTTTTTGLPADSGGAGMARRGGGVCCDGKGEGEKYIMRHLINKVRRHT